jgi:hypothetical protein
MDPVEKVGGCMARFDLAQDRGKWRPPAGKLLSGYATGGLSSSVQLLKVS